MSKSDLSNFSLSVSAVTPKGQSTDIDDYLITGDEYISGTRKIMDHIRFSEMSPETIDDYLLSLKSTWIKWEDILSGKLPEIKYRLKRRDSFYQDFIRAGTKLKQMPVKYFFFPNLVKFHFSNMQRQIRKTVLSFLSVTGNLQMIILSSRLLLTTIVL